jgi:dienelactone hydrolase
MASSRNYNFSDRVPLSRHNSGKKESKRKAFSGNRTPKPKFILLGFLLILVGVFGVLYNPSNHTQDVAPWEVSEAGTLSFSQRESPVFTAQEIEDKYAPENPDILKLLSFESEGDKIQALLRIPANSNSTSGIPGIILLPGATVSKEAEQGLAVELSKMGYATLTIDQRNLGGINFEKDLELSKTGLEPVEYSMVYDALKAKDVLAAQPQIDSEKLAILGESNGGRFAIIACALDPSFKGVIGISTSGYGTEETNPATITDSKTYRFYRSIDPDTYLPNLPPAKFVQIHSLNDTLIPYDTALRTFAVAKEPKAMYNVSDATHGYTASMRPYVEKELNMILS